ncbi:MAG: hypothetical protein KF900_02635 [Bacteroidetes bacterium]|nr:hypothetical protein [Bacteroidota bacterium]
MKYIFIIIVVFSIQACKKDSPIPLSDEPNLADSVKGRVSAEINGKQEHFFVTTDTVRNKLSRFNIYFGASYPSSYNNKSVTIGGIEKNLISQRIYTLTLDTNIVQIRTNAMFYTTWNDGDVLCEVFEALESDSLNNYVMITKQNNNYEEVFGTFSLTFIKTQDCEGRHYADTLRIRNGYFHLYLK